MNNLKDIFDKATSKIDLARRLGLPTNVNQKTLDKNLQKYADKINFDLKSLVKGTDEYKFRVYYKSPSRCLECGNIIPYEKRHNKFCSQSCAASHNNKLRPPVSDKQRQKVSKTLKEKYDNGLINHCNVKTKVKLDTNYIYKYISNNKYKILCIEKICPICHNTFYGPKSQIYCSRNCVYKSPYVKEKLRQKQLDKIKNGTHKGWQSRNIISYPEKFWMKILDNYKISYIREDNTNGKYFLDFFIKKNNKLIDLEIDGKQHQYEDRKIHDQERDEYLKMKGYIIYRIPWNTINTNDGKERMTKKIEDFILFYNSL